MTAAAAPEAMPSSHGSQPASHGMGGAGRRRPCDPGKPARRTASGTSGLGLQRFIDIDREPRRQAGQGKLATRSRKVPCVDGACPPPRSAPGLDFAPAG